MISPAALSAARTRAGLFLPDDLLSNSSTFYALLARWNQKINLTALENPDEAIDRLILEPLIAARHLPATAEKTRWTSDPAEDRPPSH